MTLRDGELLAIARRTLLFVAESLARFETLLNANEHRLNENEKLVYESLVGRAAGIRSRLFRRFRTLEEAIAHKSRPALARSTLKAGVIFTSLEELHRDLRHLPIPELRRESVDFLGAIWRRVRPLLSQEAERPSLHLSHDLIHGQHNVTGGPAVIDLPKLDYSNPLSWPLLTHEIAHSFLPTVDISPDLSPAVRSWLIEAGCDRIGLYTCGPTYFAAFALRTFVDSTYPTATNRHPAGRRRLAILEKSRVRGAHEDVLFRRIARLVRARSLATEEGSVETNAAATQLMKCQSCKKSYTTLETAEAESSFENNVDSYLAALDDRLAAIETTSRMSSRITTLKGELAERRLIGAVHDHNRAIAQFRLLKKLYSSKRRLARNAMTDQVTKTARALVDQPTDIIEIITAGWLTYLEESEATIEDHLFEAARGSDDAWRTFKQNVLHFDDLLLASIETSTFHVLMESGGNAE